MKVVWGLLIILVLLIGCRESINFTDVEPRGFWVCDTINIKYIPAKDTTIYTLRCINENGDEFIIYR